MQNEPLFIAPVLTLPVPSILSFTFLNARYLQRHADDLASDLRLINNDELDEFDKFTIAFKMNDYGSSRLTKFNQNSTYMQDRQKVMEHQRLHLINLHIIVIVLV